MTILIKPNVASVTLEGVPFLPLALHGATSWLSFVSKKATLLSEPEGRKHRLRRTQNTGSCKTTTNMKGLRWLLVAIPPWYPVAADLSTSYLREVSMHTRLPPAPPSTPCSSASSPSVTLRCSDAQMPLTCSFQGAWTSMGYAASAAVCHVLPHAEVQGGVVRCCKSQWKANHTDKLDGTKLPCKRQPCLQAQSCNIGWKGLWEIVRFNPCSKLGQTDQGAWGLVLLLLSTSEDGPLGQEPCAHTPGFDHPPHGENTFPNILRYHFLSSQQHVSLRRVCLHLL